MKRIFDPAFRYQPSYATDLRKTFARLKRKVPAPRDATVQENEARVLPLSRRRKQA